MQYQKVKSVSKEVLSRGPELEKVILRTMKTCANVVGSTLGPGGMSVVIERQEERLPPMITKDGVTVFKNLGFDDSSQHVIMEAARDAAVRTANEAGDGTTTATILAEALVRNTMEYCKSHPKVSPQRVVRVLEQTFREKIEPLVKGYALKADLGTIEGRRILHAVAKISANGDEPLADAVLDCFDLVGDEGNVTIIEASGPSGYETEKIEGYPVPMGYEDSCGAFFQGFINNTGRMICELDNPLYILYFGKINDIFTILGLFDKIKAFTEANPGQMGNNFVLVATGFSETVLAHLHGNFVTPGTPNIFPLLAPMSASKTGQYDFLLDMAALTGGKIFDPLDRPLDTGEVTDLGSTKGFESSRFRSAVIGFRDEILILERVDQLKTQLKGGVSQLDQALIQERIGKLTQGIAKLKVFGASSGEVREKRDRAEDAICSVRGTIKHGALPGGGWTLVQLDRELSKLGNSIVTDVLCKSFRDPVIRLFSNAGYNQEEIIDIAGKIGENVYDVLEGGFVDPFEGGVLDSVPAVLEAIRNSVSIAALLGTCGGTVVFKRDLSLERQESRDTTNFLRDINEADERP